MFKRKTDESKANIYAGILYLMTKSVQSFKFLRRDEKRKRQEACSNQLREIYKLEPPKFDITQIQLPILGSIGVFSDTSRVTYYNRANAALCALQHCIFPLTFTKYIVPSKRVLEVCTPVSTQPGHVMVVAPSVHKDARAASPSSYKHRMPASLSRSPLPQKCIYIQWSTKKNISSEALSAHIENFIEWYNKPLPNHEKTRVLYDPREFTSGAQWRDYIRRQLQFEDLRLDFQKLEIRDGKATIETTIPFTVLSQIRIPDWKEILELVNKFEEPLFTYTMRALNPDEDFHYELDEPPQETYLKRLQ